MAGRLTEAQHRALAWMAADPRATGRPWCLAVHPRTHDALLRKRMIEMRGGSIYATPAGRTALAERDHAEGRDDSSAKGEGAD